MAKLIIKRQKSFIGQARTFKIWIDGEVAAKVKNNETVELQIKPGSHTIRAGISWISGISKVKTFSVTDKEVINFKIFRPTIGTISMFLGSFFTVLLITAFQNTISHSLTAALLVPTLVFIIMTIEFSTDIQPIE